MESNEPVQSRKLFIGGLHHDANKDSLRKIFEQWGKVVDVVIMKDPTTKRSRGFGFVTYSQSSMVDRAMSMRPHNINGHEVDTKRAVSRDDIDTPNIKATVKKMFIFGIKEQSENDLLEYFGKFGNICNIKIVTAKDSGKRKGYGFIEYGDTDSVDKAICIKSHQVAGGKLDVSKANSRSDITGYSSSRHGGYGGGRVNRSSLTVNPRYGQCGEYHNRSNACVGFFENSGPRGGYGSIRGGAGYGGNARVYNSNSGRTLQGVYQRLCCNYPAWGYQRGGGWGVSPQPSINLGPIQMYGLTTSYHTINNHSTPNGNARAGYVYSGNGQFPGQQLY